MEKHESELCKGTLRWTPEWPHTHRAAIIRYADKPGVYVLIDREYDLRIAESPSLSELKARME